ncbi:polymeric immunoglobulin receptor [Rhynchonycteris naso]
MTLFFLACLLAVLPVVSMRSPIFGPQQVNRIEGSSASIKCYYPDTSVNRHSRKFWCRQGARGRCTTLISNSFITKDYEGRANITDFPEKNMFVVDIGHLTQSDSGHYKCGVGILNQGLFFDVSLEVRPGPGLLNGTEVYIGDLGRTVTINCPFTSANAMEKKSMCKMENKICLQIIDSNDYVNPDYNNRISLNIQDTSQLMFSVVINRLKLSDAGMYVCKTGMDSTADKHNVDLQVLEPEPELLYGDLRGSVTFDCAPGPEMKEVPKFLCRINNEKACEMVINSLGRRAEAYEGRILLISKNNGLFSVHITGLRKEDAGSYQCGADSDGEPQGGPVQTWQLFVNEETTFPRSPSVVKGVVGGSVTVLCPYKPKDRNNLKYWCHWNKKTGACSQLVSSEGLVTHKEKEQYEGRLVLYEEPGNGTYTVILNQLTPQDAGFYWCLTNGNDTRWWSTVELKIVEGEPNLKVPENTVAWVGETLKLPCHSPCKFFSYEKYWCKWSTEGCQALPSQHEYPRKASVTCDQNKQTINLILNPVTKEDEGWYWCGVKEGPRLGETVAVHVEVKKAKASHDVSRGHAAPGEEVIEPRGRGAENRVIQVPKLWAEEKAVDTGDPAGGSPASADPSRSAQGGSSTVLVSTLVPLALVLALGAVAIGVVRARHRRNVDRVSIGSYRTDISMSDFENSRDFGANDNMGATPVTQETSLGRKDEITATIEDTVETEEPKTAKRSSREEADMAYSAFLLQANNMVTNVQGGHSEA